MYSKDIIKSAIILYYKLQKERIIGKKRIEIIKNVFNIHINTLYNWNKTYYNKKTNIFDFSLYKTNFKYNNLKITNQIELFVINSIDINNNFNIKKIKNNIKINFNIILSKSSIYHILHKNNLTYKKIYVKNNPNIDEKNKILKDELKNNINNIVSYDEMSIYINQKPYKGWSKKGKSCIIETKNKTIFNKRYSIGMGITINGKIDFTIVEGALKSFKFNKFMKNNYIFMDNASIHTSSLFKKFVNDNNFNVIYNIPYHSELNPIEYIFSLLRKELLNNDNSSYSCIINIIINFMKNFNKKYSFNIFKKCFDIIKK